MHDDSSGIIGIGLWTIENMMTMTAVAAIGGQKHETIASPARICAMPVFSENHDSLTMDDDMYDTLLIGTSALFSFVRILTLFGVIVAFGNLVRTVHVYERR